MNGVASQSMRTKGVDYKLNWGVSLPDLKAMAAEYGKDYDLAVALWKENVRECKIMATMIMPAENMLPDLVELWMEETTTQELAEFAVFNLYQYLPFSADLAFEWIASDKPLYLLSGFQLLACIFKQKKGPNERDINEFLDQAQVALDAESLPVKHAAMNALYAFCDLGDDYERLAHSALPDYL
jgi:hypothetical protein